MSSPQIQMPAPSRDAPIWLWRLQSPERITPPLTAERKYSTRVYLELWPTLNTHTAPAQSIQGPWTWGRRWSHRSSSVPLLAVCLWGIFLISYQHGHSCGLTGLCVSTNDTVSGSQQDSHRTVQPLCSAHPCQHQLKVGIFKSNTSLTWSTASCKQRN